MILLQVDQALATGNVWLSKIKNMAIDYAPRLLGAVLVYIVGSWLINRISAGLRRLLTTRKFDPSLQKFLVSVMRATLMILLLLAIAGMIGVNTTSFAAILAGAGLAIGAALNGSLGNLAGGVMIMVFKPFKIGDMIEAQGSVGIVQEIGIFNTTILSPENKTIFLPNGALSTGVITNYNTHGNLRVDLVIAIAPDMDIDKARQVASNAMLSHPKVLKLPAPEVSVLKIADGMVQLAIRPYTTQSEYWDVYFGVQELVKKAFDTHQIAGPVPHRVIIHK